MKKLVSFRIEEETLLLLEMLAKEYDTTKVHILENAIKTYANIKKFKKKDLMKFCGKLSKEDVKAFRNIK
ncbi:hypothetical protein [Caminibacter pacificus]|uniref:Ribbon-helix-helix protein, copG family n=1 Tax=Caminibacter pacificus TaxID=1424653 RepID=A0AAJ4RBK7_9BACT|nr:hypothetical protein [Caminibacter pacificus]NPA87609.1 hypothetical protein [Campylobacterota bacterium]QCI29146.1 hypothetical protein C6V80_09310 [Caminibacter pacificus]ROR39035.1 hypothetical protein EDC58_1526 [Caminibacter pacificus]